jgi:hypothetical protein
VWQASGPATPCGVQKWTPVGLQTWHLEDIPGCNCLRNLVGLPGFEPGTSCTPSKRASAGCPTAEVFSWLPFSLRGLMKNIPKQPHIDLCAAEPRGSGQPTSNCTENHRACFWNAKKRTLVSLLHPSAHRYACLTKPLLDPHYPFPSVPKASLRCHSRSWFVRDSRISLRS